jgi:peptidoglycan/xylan/chitin deacetylase (PgdA/CDA1 family)
MVYIFNFHRVDNQPAPTVYQHLTITPDGLRRVIQLCRALGLTPISFEDALNHPERLCDQHFLLTFDDGYENLYHHAWPVLEAEQCPATIFALAGKLGGENDWDTPYIPGLNRLLSAEQMVAMAQSPYIRFGSHGLHHRALPMVSAKNMQAEMMDSYHILSDLLGNAFVPVMAYPWGEYSQKVINLISRTPYQAAVTTEKGLWDQTAQNPYAIPRYSIYHRDRHTFILLAKLLRYGAGSLAPSMSFPPLIKKSPMAGLIGSGS